MLPLKPEPQQYSTDPVVIPHVCEVPSVRLLHLRPPVSFIGSGEQPPLVLQDVVIADPLPSCPAKPEPQHHASSAESMAQVCWRPENTRFHVRAGATRTRGLGIVKLADAFNDPMTP